MTNTRILYEYRDGSNNKARHEVILPGTLDDADQARLIAALERGASDSGLGGFIPGQVGLRDLQNAFYEGPIRVARAAAEVSDAASDIEKAQARQFADLATSMSATPAIWWPEDGPWHEVFEIGVTSAGPTVDMPIEALVSRMVDITWDESYLPPFHAEMLANYERHLANAGDDLEPE